MEIGRKITRLFWLYIAAVIGAFALSLLVFILCFGFGLFYTPTAGTLIIYLAVPLGCPLGMYLIDRRAYGPLIYPIWRVVFAFLGAGIGIWISSIIKDKRIIMFLRHYEGFIVTFLPPFIVAFFSVLGYLLPGLFRRKKLQLQ